MTDSENGENNNKSGPGEHLSGLWSIFGLPIGVAFAKTYGRYRGYDGDETLSFLDLIIVISLMVGPMIMFAWIADALREDVLSNKSTWATYWSTMFGIAVAALALAGYANFGDILKALD